MPPPQRGIPSHVTAASRGFRLTSPVWVLIASVLASGSVGEREGTSGSPQGALCYGLGTDCVWRQDL